MANVLLTRTSTPSSKAIIDGQLIFDTSGNGKMYLDNGTDRLEMGGAMEIDQVLDKTSTNPISNKGVAGAMLTNMTDISAVTRSGYLPDALAIKKLGQDISGMEESIADIVEKGAKMRNLDYTNMHQFTSRTEVYSTPKDGILFFSVSYCPGTYGDTENTLKINGTSFFRASGPGNWNAGIAGYPVTMNLPIKAETDLQCSFIQIGEPTSSTSKSNWATFVPYLD